MSGVDVFERLSDRYDSWYDSAAGRAVFPAEVECLEPLLWPFGWPRLEVGIGIGRVAAALNIDLGVDPATAPLTRARSRGIRVVRALGEHLPFRSESFAVVLLVVTLCFTGGPAAR